MTLREFFEVVYRPVRLLGRSESTVADMRSWLSVWETLTADPQIEDVTELIVCEFLHEATLHGRSAATANKYRSYIRAVLHHAAKRRRLAADWLDDLPRLPETERLPVAFSLSEFERILRAACLAPGESCGVPLCRWWPALLLTIYDTSWRIGSVRSLRTEDCDLSHRWLVCRRNKQRREELRFVSEQTTIALGTIWHVGRERLFPWPASEKTMARHFARICKLAGVAYGGHSGLFHKIRKTTASLCDANGGNAQLHLGHSSPVVTRIHYLDPRICGERQLPFLPRPKF